MAKSIELKSIHFIYHFNDFSSVFFSLSMTKTDMHWGKNSESQRFA